MSRWQSAAIRISLAARLQRWLTLALDGTGERKRISIPVDTIC
jgi:hypothetical protein